ncbi:FRG domain-containing protein [Breznakia pachnodae]|uniref:Acid stress-induced BolA-like protein IbaG/YrbA n=1 Tax=Breznakia pachnodae TaxID=265178 RepID=A0ABU0E5X4_9FIRM|nr:FRG domain-containing protein [Breznakia pachnodae]MDQ0362190.1 acid stress-induced BolA-like protein IbaG/YrbA [Breznakia pachnodae]
MENGEKVESVANFLEKIKQILDEENLDCDQIVYRGEPEEYSTPCVPNLFRNDNYLKNEYYEKNVLDEVIANRLSKGKSYIEVAIDSQHGGFPSRLLDISYNSLIALLFATTPHYTKPVDSSDKKDGVVFIIKVNRMFSASSEGAKCNYDSLISNKDGWIHHPIFHNNHKLIDFSALNKRIVAQQGGMILFQGLVASKLSKLEYEKIIINHKYKVKIREELFKMFGYDNGFVYPEINNLVNSINTKSILIDNRKFSELVEIKNTLDIMKDRLSKYIENAEYSKKNTFENIIDFEETIVLFIDQIKNTLIKENLERKLYEELVEELYRYLKNLSMIYGKEIHGCHINYYIGEFEDLIKKLVNNKKGKRG